MGILDDQIFKAKADIRTDDYPMSLGELSNLYKDGELRISPAYQRLFRWTNAQKSAFFESVLIGIPIPPIFVFELENGHWELIDGLQRTSTLLEFQGLLKDADGKLKERSVLQATEYLPALSGAVWDSEKISPLSDEFEIGSENRIAIKRSKIGIQILKKDSDERSKFELFQRLNGNGTPLRPQEYRTCVMVMLDERKYDECSKVAKNSKLIKMLSLSKGQLEKQSGLDYVSRFLAHYTADIPKQFDVDEFITHQVKELFIQGPIDEYLKRCLDTSRFLTRHLGADVLRKFDGKNFSGKVGKTAFEGIFVGIATNLEEIKTLENPADYLKKAIMNFWQHPITIEVMGPGIRGTTRLEKTVPLGRELFKPSYDAD